VSSRRRPGSTLLEKPRFGGVFLAWKARARSSVKAPRSQAIPNPQGPLCAIACGDDLSQLFRAGQWARQTPGRQIDSLRDRGTALGNQGNRFWAIRNGFALCRPSPLREIRHRLESCAEGERDCLRGLLRGRSMGCLGHRLDGATRFPSFLLCTSARIHANSRRTFGSVRRLILEATYEATQCAAAIKSRAAPRTSRCCRTWAAIGRAIERSEECGSDVRLVK
jgi:hypothetical protein